MRAAAALLALPAILALTAQTPPPHPRPSGSPFVHHNDAYGSSGRDGRPAIIIITGVSTLTVAKPSPPAKPTPTPMGNPQVFESHSSTDAR